MIFILSTFTYAGHRLYPYLALWPLPHTQLWQPVTYAFLHGGMFHLAFNMFGLWMFGRVVEQQLGFARFAQYPMCSAQAACAPQVETIALARHTWLRLAYLAHLAHLVSLAHLAHQAQDSSDSAVTRRDVVSHLLTLLIQCEAVPS